VRLFFALLISGAISSSSFGQVDSLLNVAREYVGTNLDSSRMVFDMALAECKRLNNDSLLINITCKYARTLGWAGEHEIAMYYLNRAKALKSPLAMFKIIQYRLYHEYFTSHYMMRDDYDSGFYYVMKQLPLAPDSVLTALCYNRLGLVYNSMGDMVKALESYNTALAYQQSPKTPIGDFAMVYNNMGILYEDDGDLERAEELWLKSLAIREKEVGAADARFNLWNNLAILYEHQKRYDESLAMMKKAEALLPELDDFRSKAMVAVNTGNTLVRAGRAAESVPLFKTAIVNFGNEGNDRGVCNAHRQLAEAYKRLGNYRDAEREAFIAVDIAVRRRYLDLERDAYIDLSDIYDATKDYQKAFKYQILFRNIHDSLTSHDRRSKVGLLEKKYELAQQAKAKDKLERENELHVIQARVDNVTRVSLISGLVVLGVVAFGFVVAYRQSRDRNRLLAEQKAMIEEQSHQLQEAAKAKAKFFTNVSHELRTPVTLLNGMLELMQESNNAGALKEKMDIALGSSRRLQYLVGEVLDLSRVDNAKVQLNKKTVEIYPLLTRIVYAFESLLIKKNISLEFEANDLRNTFVELDADKFEKVINNLVYNAVKFNKDGGWIKVTGNLSGESMIIGVADSGIGIPEKDIPHVFDRFYQAPVSNNVDGIGVGLSLVKEFTVMHGGDVSVTSRLNEGTAFTITFPLGENPGTHGDETLAIPDVNFSEFGKSTVLIVEDNDEMRYYLREILGANITTLEARNGREALKYLRDHKPDLILSDVMMPEMDGNELIKQLKGSDNWKRIPVVVLTARAAEDDLLHFLSFGVDDYIIKPFNARELKIRIHNLLSNQQLRKQWISKPVEEEERGPVVTETDVFLKRVRAFVEDNISNPNPGIGDLADHMAMSERQLYRRCGAAAGMTPDQLIKDIKLDIAWHRLMNKNVTKVSELAHSLGYENVSYFSRLFGERYGKRPADLL
jgi:signal transduction histidine kinase/CheY-like chemotaxis protein/AraC-like DNA-binding protein